MAIATAEKRISKIAMEKDKAVELFSTLSKLSTSLQYTATGFNGLTSEQLGIAVCVEGMHIKAASYHLARAMYFSLHDVAHTALYIKALLTNKKGDMKNVRIEDVINVKQNLFKKAAISMENIIATLELSRRICINEIEFLEEEIGGTVEETYPAYKPGTASKAKVVDSNEMTVDKAAITDRDILADKDMDVIIQTENNRSTKLSAYVFKRQLKELDAIINRTYDITFKYFIENE